MLAPSFPKLNPQLADTFISGLFMFALLRSLSWLKFVSLCCKSASEKKPEFQRNVWIGHFSQFFYKGPILNPNFHKSMVLWEAQSYA